jgi:hypothetical protein
MKRTVLQIILATILALNSVTTIASAASCTPGGPANQCGDPTQFKCVYNTGTATYSCQRITTTPPPYTSGNGVPIGNYFNVNFFGTGNTTIGGFVTSLLPQIYTISLILVILYLIWGSYRYLVSGGDAKAVAAAKAHLTYAVIGMIIVFLSYGIYLLISSLVGFVYY